MKTEKIAGITLIALVITIIILLILAGISIVALTSQNGILNKANNAKEETQKTAAKEKVQIAVGGSFSTEEIIDNTSLRENLDKVEGIKWDSRELTDEDFTLTVTVDGYDVEIEKNGKVTLKGETSGSAKPDTPESGIEAR